MRFLDANDMLWKLRHVKDGDTVFVSYLAGRPPTEKAIAEAVRHTEDPTRPRRYYLGELTSCWQAQNGDWILTMKVFNRDTMQKDGTLQEGGYRSFNPSLGELILIDHINRP
jgi:hypothetical protein